MPRKGYLSFTYYYGAEAGAILARLDKKQWKAFIDSAVVNEAGRRANADRAGTNPLEHDNTRGRTNESKQRDP